MLGDGGILTTIISHPKRMRGEFFAADQALEMVDQPENMQALDEEQVSDQDDKK